MIGIFNILSQEGRNSGFVCNSKRIIVLKSCEYSEGILG
jgi:hypothetical protein